MTDETVHIQPAIPSRADPARGSPFNPPLPDHRAFIDNPSPGTQPSEKMKRRREGTKKGMATKAAKKAKTLSSAEIKKINAKRAKSQKARSFQRGGATHRGKLLIEADLAKKAKKRRVRKVGTMSTPRPPKNPNRPLEMKNQLSAVLSMVGTLQKAELVFFSQAVPAMQALSRSGRKRVIAALQQVYG